MSVSISIFTNQHVPLITTLPFLAPEDAACLGAVSRYTRGPVRNFLDNNHPAFSSGNAISKAERTSSLKVKIITEVRLIARNALLGAIILLPFTTGGAALLIRQQDPRPEIDFIWGLKCSAAAIGGGAVVGIAIGLIAKIRRCFGRAQVYYSSV